MNDEIIPSPGTANKDWKEVQSKVELVRPFVKTIHIDVLDGKYADNKTFLDPEPFKEYVKQATEILFEVHFMVENPLQYLKPWADAGFQRFIGQIEKMPDQVEFVAQAQLLGEVALAIDKQTPVEAITVPFDDLDALLVMTIQAGFSGQEFQEELLEKVKKLSALTTIPIAVDGGINDETILVTAASGATRFVATSFLFGVGTPKEQYTLLKNILKNL